MAVRLSRISRSGYTQICVARGSVSLGSEDNGAAGELQLWYRGMDNCYRLHASKTAGVEIWVCKVFMFLLCTSKSALTKSKRY